MLAHEGAAVKLPVHYGGAAFLSKAYRLTCLELQLPPKLLGLLNRQFWLIGVGHEFRHLHGSRSLLAVHVGLLANDHGGGALNTHTRV